MSQEPDLDETPMGHIASRRPLKDRGEILERLRSEAGHARVDGSAVDDLIAERRAEAHREDSELDDERRVSRS